MTSTTTASAATAPTQFVRVRDHQLAYRSIGKGPPLVLCLRFRGVLDSWDPAFLDALAREFRVITFDYSGLGQSTGSSSYVREALANDALELIDALRLERVVIGGWSLGGLAAQVLTASHPERVSHAVLIGTGPPGPQPHATEPVFLPTATRFENDLEDEIVLFFEPRSEPSRAAARASRERIAARRGDRSSPVPEATYLRLLREASHPSAIFADENGYAAALSRTSVPLLAISGDHDIVFPVENWYALNRRWSSLHLLTLPQAGHGPQHQEPEMCADAITSFVKHVRGAGALDASRHASVGTRHPTPR
jgi:pimeloyl-ACP methyl ester carboxylesterase